MTSLFPDTSGILNFIMSLLMSVFTIIQSLTASSLPEQLDLSEFELVWEDDFNGDALDTSVWSGHQLWNTDTVVRKGGYWNLDFATVSDGNFISQPNISPTDTTATVWQAGTPAVSHQGML